MLISDDLKDMEQLQVCGQVKKAVRVDLTYS